MKIKKVPLRMCIACHQMFAKKEMLRIVKDKNGDINIDFSGKANGRGAYICNSLKCQSDLVKKRLLNKTFSADVPIEIYEKIGREFGKGK